MNDYKAVWCYDREGKTNKQFKIARMDSVELLSDPWYDEDRHQVPFSDAFRMSAEAPLAEVEAFLSLKAYNLLIEEYPRAAQYVQARKNKYQLNIPVADYNGIGRFVMGLPGEVVVSRPEEFKKFLEGKRKVF
jgi:predicted DNA-binding transcriptional regulator YafY